MTRRFELMVALLAGSVASTASAQLVVLSDNFNSYTNGNLVGQGGWTQTGTVATNPLQVSGSPSGVVPLLTSGQDAYKAFSSPVPMNPTESIESQFDITITAVGATGDYFFHLSDPVGTTGNFYQRVQARSSTGGFQLGLLETSGTGTITWGTTDLALNTPYTVKVVWNFVAGPINDTFTLAVNNVNYLNHTWTSTTAEPTTLSAANLRQGTAANAAAGQFDNLTVTAVPGPGSAACLVSGLLIAGRRRRR